MDRTAPQQLNAGTWEVLVLGTRAVRNYSRYGIAPAIGAPADKYSSSSETEDGIEKKGGTRKLNGSSALLLWPSRIQARRYSIMQLHASTNPTHARRRYISKGTKCPSVRVSMARHGANQGQACNQMPATA